MELFHKIYQNCRGLRILRSTIEPANSHSQFFLSVALLRLSFFLQFLLKSGKGKRLVEEYDRYENTPLHVAAKKGYVRIVQVSSNSRVSLKAGTGPEHPPPPSPLPDGPDPSGNTLNYQKLGKKVIKLKTKLKNSCSGDVNSGVFQSCSWFCRQQQQQQQSYSGLHSRGRSYYIYL